jgi:hypothetical protein
MLKKNAHAEQYGRPVPDWAEETDFPADALGDLVIASPKCEILVEDYELSGAKRMAQSPTHELRQLGGCRWTKTRHFSDLFAASLPTVQEPKSSGPGSPSWLLLVQRTLLLCLGHTPLKGSIDPSGYERVEVAGSRVATSTIFNSLQQGEVARLNQILDVQRDVSVAPGRVLGSARREIKFAPYRIFLPAPDAVPPTRERSSRCWGGERVPICGLDG